MTMTIGVEIIKKAWEIRKRGTNSMKELAEHFGVDVKELSKGIEEMAKQEEDL
jgi:predicted transcriptional regulator